MKYMKINFTFFSFLNIASRIFESTFKAHSFGLHYLSLGSMHILGRRGHCELHGVEGQGRREAVDRGLWCEAMVMNQVERQKKEAL